MLVDAILGLPSLSGKTVVEVGCGAALGLIAALRRGARGLGTDRNGAALRLAGRNVERNGLRASFVRTDLLAPVDPSGVDLVLFNPPYLPTEPHERLPGALNLAFDGGPTGNETLLRFADTFARWRDAGMHVPEVLLVTSSLNDRRRIRSRLADAGLVQVEELGMRGFSFERLFAERFF